jgi:hypothetical protein
MTPINVLGGLDDQLTDAVSRIVRKSIPVRRWHGEAKKGLARAKLPRTWKFIIINTLRPIRHVLNASMAECKLTKNETIY